ncbi:branched-chain amino acid ABC transporter substrate-binding protein [Methylobacterium sp. sgz302541]|uniref:branched-chain amino acid ABC transporter substrate-binding protein n=1 Tax=unclassified Methylobacterium TaxID=2615210 RepID=UPI003D332BD8
MRLSPPAALVLLSLGAPSALAQQGPLRIGLSAPLTGPDAGFGQGMRLGAEQAVADINRNGGVAGRKLALVVADDAGDGKQGAAVAKRFAADRIGLVVGPLSTIVAAVAAPVYEEAGIVTVTPGATGAALTGRGWWNLLRLGASDAQQAATAAAYLNERFAGRRIGIVHDRTTFGRGLADAVSRALKARGNGEAAFLGLQKGAKDAADVLAPLKDARVEAVYFGGLAQEGAVLAKGLREAGLDAVLIGSDGLLDKDFPAIAGPAAEGTVMTLPADPRKLPEPKGKPAGRTPETDAFAGQGYAAVEVLARGVERAKSAEGRKVAAALRDGAPLRLSTGEVAFDAKGDLARPDIQIRVWRRTPDGRLDYAGNESAP